MLEKRSKTHIKMEERLDEILKIAEPMILSGGMRELKLNDVIDQCSVSRATFYTLIPTKETLIAYLAIKGFNKLIEYGERCKTIDDKARVKFLGNYISYVFFLKLYPVLHQCVHESISYSYRSILATSLIHLYDKKMNQAIGFIQWCIEQAIFDRDIKLPERITPYDFAFYIWSGHFGVMIMSESSEHNAMDASKKYKYYVRQMLDFLPWYPLSTEMDYDLLSQKIVSQIFMEEYLLIGPENFKT